MAFYRQILDAFEKWKHSQTHKPLVIRGARQVGKTTVVKEFGKSFDTFLMLNLERPEDRAIFETSLSPKTAFQRICLEKRVRPKGKTLLFLDEIQNSPQAVAMLRYFYEDLPELYVISAGSLLEIMMDVHKVSFPVGRVEYLFLYPMTFREFLKAMGEDDILNLLDEIPLPEWALPGIYKLFREYTMVGGMPEAVSKYRNDRNILDCAPVYRNLYMSYVDDVAKYAKNITQEQILRTFIESAPLETGKRIAFEKFANTHYKSREAGDALRMLERAMLIYLRYPTTATQLPLQTDLKRRPRLQFLDTGLLNYKADIQSGYLSDISLDSMFNGMIAEQIVGQEYEKIRLDNLNILYVAFTRARQRLHILSYQADDLSKSPLNAFLKDHPDCYGDSASRKVEDSQV
ncbi:MAG: AAA family ATPase, partial [Proteobacteria bacterium]|nr:AAA family ATPase [Pseudomonadota bacterium]